MRAVLAVAGAAATVNAVVASRGWQAGEAVDVSVAAGEPAYLIRTGDRIRALSATCTHARRAVAWLASSRQFLCPCHRSSFDSQRSVVSGPPSRALDELPIVVEKGMAYLQS